MISKTPDLFWGVITSMNPGNILLLILNLPLIGVWTQLLKVLYRILCTLILLLCLIEIYSLNNSIFGIYLMGGFRILGYMFKKLGFEPAPRFWPWSWDPCWKTRCGTASSSPAGT